MAGSAPAPSPRVIFADLNLTVGLGQKELLGISINCNKFYAFEARSNHAVNGIITATPMPCFFGQQSDRCRFRILAFCRALLALS